MSDIRLWLEELGLDRYAEAFEENEIEPDVLSELTDGALKELGVSVMGHRLKLLKAITALAPTNREIGATEEHSAQSAPSPPEAERRQITVMFCDLVGSTALSEELDPEDLREVMAAYQKTAGAVVERYDGHVAQYLGDGLMTYFGWPTAHEDDAQRAVRAGLEIVAAVQGIEAPAALSVRVGISTGPVVVGETGAGDAAVPKAAVGETPNVAARVQGLAEPNTVTVGETTQRLIGGAFDLEDLGAQTLKGVAAPINVFRVTGASDVETRFDASHGAGLTPLVGRDEEVGLLLKRWEQAKDGEGQVILLSGEAGIGKSRITQALREHVMSESHTRLRYQCSPYYTNSAFYSVIAQFERAAEFEHEDTPEQKLDKLEALLALSAENVTDIAPLFAALLSLPSDRYPPLNLSPQKQKEDTITALADQVVLLAGAQPVLMIFEDAHWIDPSTLEVLGAVIERVRETPVLIVITYRPEFEPPWAGHDHVGTLTLNRLSRRHGADMVAGVIGGKALPNEVLDQIVAKTDGVPLFVEELTKTVLEAGLLKEVGDRYELDGPLPPLAIPSTLQDSLMARLDRLGLVKEVAQTGACIGREFAYALLAAVSPLRDNELQDALQQLTSSELIFRRGIAPGSTYTFKHALVQDAAYRSLLNSKRQQLHARIATVLEKRFPVTGPNNPEVLADHLTKAGLGDKAVKYWIMAGVRAKEVFANDEATVHLQVALELMGSLLAHDEPGSMSLRQQSAQVLVMLGDIASQTGELERANQYYEEALQLPLDEDFRHRIENKRHRPKHTVRDGARIVYYEHGSGEETLLFINPILYGLAIFHPILEELCQEFRIVTVDCRGAGMSDPLPQRYSMHQHAEDAAAVIEALGGEPVIGVGISYGSNQLFRLAHGHPHLLKKIVTIGSPTGCILSDNPTPCRAEYIRRIKDAIEVDNLEAAVRIHAEEILSEPEGKGLIEFFCDLCSHLSPETVLSFFNCESTIEITSILATVEQPTLVTHGTADLCIPFAAAAYIAERLPNAQIYGFHEKGHLPIFTATEEFCDVLRKFVYQAPVAGNERDQK